MTVVLLAGGVDSAVLAQLVDEPRALSVLYGQRHGQEVTFAQRQATAMRITWELVDLGRPFNSMPNALTGDVPVPEGHYAAPAQMKTIVPSRNLILLQAGVHYAQATGDHEVVYGAQADDHAIYMDCRAEWVAKADQLMRLQTDGQVGVRAPLVGMRKHEIVALGAKLGVDWTETWSCYHASEEPCGRCGACVERREAFHLADVIDPWPYRDPSFWRTVT